MPVNPQSLIQTEYKLRILKAVARQTDPVNTSVLIQGLSINQTTLRRCLGQLVEADILERIVSNKVAYYRVKK